MLRDIFKSIIHQTQTCYNLPQKSLIYRKNPAQKARVLRKTLQYQTPAEKFAECVAAIG